MKFCLGGRDQHGHTQHQQLAQLTHIHAQDWSWTLMRMRQDEEASLIASNSLGSWPMWILDGLRLNTHDPS